MYKVAIVEDEDNNADILNNLLEIYSQKHTIEFLIDRYKNGVLFLSSDLASYDIVFMDVDMPLMNGFEVSKQFRKINESSVLIFTTVLAKYASRGYEVDAMDYIVKPLDYDGLAIRLDKAINKCKYRESAFVTLPYKLGEIKIDINSLKYIEIKGHLITYHVNREEYQFYGTLKKVEALLPEGLFSRCNNCYLVNLRRVTRIEGDDVYLGDESIKMSRPRKKTFFDAFHKKILGVKS